jgi:hypothetical protein
MLHAKILFFVLFEVLIITVIGCDDKESSVNSEHSISGLSYLGATGGVCDNSALSKTVKLQRDSVNVYVTEDSIRVIAGVNYNCGTPFETSCTIKDKKVKMYIKDVCLDVSSCYERCKCHYTFEFRFARKGEIDYNYSVELKSPLPNQSTVLSEGMLVAR